MLAEGMLHGECLTVTGKSLAENLALVEDLKEEQDLIHSINNPIKATGHIRILKGNIASARICSKNHRKRRVVV